MDPGFQLQAAPKGLAHDNRHSETATNSTVRTTSNVVSSKSLVKGEEKVIETVTTSTLRSSFGSGKPVAAASVATSELDELMSSLNDFKMAPKDQVSKSKQILQRAVVSQKTFGKIRKKNIEEKKDVRVVLEFFQSLWNGSQNSFFACQGLKSARFCTNGSVFFAYNVRWSSKPFLLFIKNINE